MKMLAAQTALAKFSFARGGILSRRDIQKILGYEKEETFKSTLKRLTSANVVSPITRGVYQVNSVSNEDGYSLERVALELRKGHYSYLSLESALSEYGAISQVPVDRLTIMTTGRKSTHKTTMGVIEFTHTGRGLEGILEGTVSVPGRPLRIATLETALRDLKRVGRNLGMVIDHE